MEHLKKMSGAITGNIISNGGIRAMSDFSNVIDRYESVINKSQNMLMESNSSISGYFKNESLEIGIKGIDDRYLKNILASMEEYMSTINESELLAKKDMSEMIDVPGVKQWLTYYQALSHESFHLIQSLTMQAVSEYVYWIRQFRDYEFMAFAMNLSAGGYWKAGQDKSLLNAVSRIEDIDFRDWLERTVEKNDSLEIFESYIENIHGISTFELVEGTAVAFQELVTHSVGVNVHDFSDNGLYTNAYQYFLEQGGSELSSDETRKTLFLYMGYTSLHYGSVSKLHFGSEWDDPVKIFIYLCQFIEEYENLLKAPTIMYSEYINFLTINKKNATYKTKEFRINDLSSEYVKSIQTKFDTGNQLLLSQHINLLKKLRESVCVYFSKNNVTHMCNVRKHLDRKMKPLNEYLADRVPLFGNFYFIAFLLSDIEISSTFINMVGNNKLSSVTVEAANGKAIDNEMDTAFSRCMGDFKDYLQNGAAYCCEKHGVTSRKRDMITCIEKGSLRERIKMFGNHVELKNSVQFD